MWAQRSVAIVGPFSHLAGVINLTAIKARTFHAALNFMAIVHRVLMGIKQLLFGELHMIIKISEGLKINIIFKYFIKEFSIILGKIIQ